MALYHQLSEDILHGRLGVNDRLSENALSERYGVSRTPIREALTRLEQDGMIVRQGSMARIRVRTAEEINDIYRARTWLERAIAQDAATRHRETDLLRLRAAWQNEDGLDPTDATPLDLMIANRVFHQALAAAAHNAALTDLQARLTLQVAQLPATTLSAPGRWHQAHEQHRQIIELVEQRDELGAGALAELHIAQARDIRLSLGTAF
ncbi:GntR family transcriptional regulator [Mycobacterium sp. Root135]|uniref:GntR family transcriptional regulator n=1 Tax=Mycobacterium sp. Root135 TaxID=1736457 RepID=UPI00138EDDE7|nr:GntR family transcriptional regulator [Mycobacterium sp. Root135]